MPDPLLPPIPSEPVREGARWRFHRPSTEEVAEWFASVPLDEGMQHADYVSGVVLIPANEKVKHQTERGTVERQEQTYTPYMRVDTRVTYFRKLAEARDLIAVIEPVDVPHTDTAGFRNDHMPLGFWWHVAGTQQAAKRFLCCTMRVALYRKEDWFAGVEELPQNADKLRQYVEREPRPQREGTATKQVAELGSYGPDPNALLKAETGAVGRALGMAGILVIGTGIATAEDLAELREPAAPAPALPDAPAEQESEEALNERLMALQARLRPLEEPWQRFAAWWQERAQEGGWGLVTEAPVEVRRGVAKRMEELIESGGEAGEDSSRGEPNE